MSEEILEVEVGAYHERQEKETGEITAQLAIQKNKIDKIGKSLAELEQLLQPILASEIEKSEEDSKEEGLQTLLGESIRKNSDGLDTLMSRIRILASRVKI